ncbi:sialoadhesin-like [Salminus brasiliensis]|uniref:sialoadhesin-like n=1 Tax=Salminus brasiliensis TaxID=930266 RepID=UPI003B831807
MHCDSLSGSVGESLRVVCDPQTICALQESEVKLRCSYSNTNIRAVFWFSSKQKAKWRNEEHPEDLTLDSDYAGRVNYTETTSSSSTLTIRDLRERDSGEYQLLIITDRGETHLSSAAVSLTVTVLQVNTHIGKTGQTLTCSTSCSLTSGPRSYSWYKNGQYVFRNGGNKESLVLTSIADAGSYSCSVSGHDKIRSSSVCVFDRNCWSVTYTDRRVCVLEGSSVDFPCTYSYPSDHILTEVFWHYLWPEEGVKNISEEERFAGRVEFIGDKERNCTLRMREVRKNDSGEYYFRIITKMMEGNKKEKFSGSPGVILNVTDLQVRVSSSTASSDGQTVTLTCSSTCTLPDNTTYTWYKNGQPVTNKPSRDNKLYLNSASSEDALQYSCALGGPEESSVLTLVTVGVVVVFLALLLITAALWMWRRKSKEQSGQCDSTHVYDTTAPAVTPDPSPEVASDDQDSIHYASVHFKQSPSPFTSRLPVDTADGQDVQYAAVNFSRHTAAP